jgi:hypothetical protein
MTHRVRFSVRRYRDEIQLSYVATDLASDDAAVPMGDVHFDSHRAYEQALLGNGLPANLCDSPNSAGFAEVTDEQLAGLGFIGSPS